MAEKPIKTKREESLSMRITPRMRFGLELLARHRKTNIGGAVILSVERMFETDRDGLRLVPDHGLSAVNILDKVWSPYEHERFARLAQYSFNLLSDEEKYLWGVVTATAKYWIEGKSAGPDRKNGESMQVHDRTLNMDALETDWSKLKLRAGIQN